MNEPPVSHLDILKKRWQGFLRTGKRVLPFVLSILIALSIFFLYNFLVVVPSQMTAAQVNDTVAQALGSATPPPAYSAQVYRVVQPSLVLIQTEGPGGIAGHQEYGLGSGVVVDQAGDILTSLHVVANATRITVTFADGTESSAQIAMTQPENDIAMLQAQILPSVIAPAVLGNANSMRVGDEAFVVGNPFGLYSSMSAGVISGFDRSFKPPEGDFTLKGLIQIDAAVNPGNSGGPLLNRDGQVIGIVTGIVNPTEQNFFVGIGFAVPIETALGGLGSPPY